MMLYFVIKGNLANIYLTLNYFSKAKELYVEDLDRLKENNLHDRYATALLGISQIYKEEKRTKLAFKYAKQSVDSYEKSDDQCRLCYCYIHTRQYLWRF
jgi:tetratricopeptide (TPR) repeat protein